MLESFGSLFLVVIILVYLYLGFGVILALLFWVGSLSMKGLIRWQDLDLIDPELRIKTTILIIVCWPQLLASIE